MTSENNLFKDYQKNESHSEAQLLRGLQKHSIPLVPPPQFFPQDFQLTEELLNPGAAWVLCTDQPVTLLRKTFSTHECRWWLRNPLTRDVRMSTKDLQSFCTFPFSSCSGVKMPPFTLLTTSILALLLRISCSRACWHLLAASSPSELAIEHTCVATETLSFSQDKVWGGKQREEGWMVLKTPPKKQEHTQPVTWLPKQ